MARPTWVTFEETVRGIAAQIWSVVAKPGVIAGVALDTILRVNNDLLILVEATERFDLNKVREDVAKLVTAKNHLFLNQQSFAKCYCVVNHDHVTPSMIAAGESQKINVVSIKEFKREFFDFDRYTNERRKHRFGSAVDPDTGKVDEIPYISTSYRMGGTSRDLDIRSISELLVQGAKFTLTGPYGAGKSRCVHELFKFISALQEDEHCYPIAIDLRQSWGLKRFQELIRRHFDDLGLDSVGSDVLRGLPSANFVFLLDGFDEIGSQAWSRDTVKLRSIRSQSLEGVRSLLHHYNGGVLITGRDHYFDTDEEMLSELGLSRGKSTILRCHEEFSLHQLKEYFSRLDRSIDLPSWLPRRPLICKTIAKLSDESLEKMFEAEEGDIAFWKHFVKVLCERDASVSDNFDAETVYAILRHLAHGTRSKPGDVGPIALSEVQAAFEAVVGQSPTEQASLMLQRLPGLGRVEAASSDRQFVDGYIIDGLRAMVVADTIKSVSGDFDVASWRNPLDRLGHRILGEEIKLSNTGKRSQQALARASSEKNRVLAGDILGGMQWSGSISIDYQNVHLAESHFKHLDLRITRANNIRLSSSLIEELVFPDANPDNCQIEETIIERISGLTSARGVPSWVKECSIAQFQSTENLSRIRQIGLSHSHEILTTIIRKTFFQPGSGRKEEALSRGLGSRSSKAQFRRVLAILVNEQVLDHFQGENGRVYTPNRSLTDRMDKMLSEMNFSKDEIWLCVAGLEKGLSEV